MTEKREEYQLAFAVGDADPGDFEVVRRTLKKARRWAGGQRYGGLIGLYTDCTQALEALDRIEGKGK